MLSYMFYISLLLSQSLHVAQLRLRWQPIQDVGWGNEKQAVCDQNIIITHTRRWLTRLLGFIPNIIKDTIKLKAGSTQSYCYNWRFGSVKLMFLLFIVIRLGFWCKRCWNLTLLKFVCGMKANRTTTYVCFVWHNELSNLKNMARIRR